MPFISMSPSVGGRIPKLGWMVLQAAILVAVAVSSTKPLMAGETDRSSAQLSECIASPDNPCPDIAEVPPRAATQTPQVKRSMKMTRSPEAADQSVHGVLPSAKIGQTTQTSPMAVKTVKTKLILRNWSYYPVYWRLGALRGSSFVYWPSTSNPYSLGARSKVTKSISCRKGEVIGFGAETTNGYYVWGYGAWAQYYPYCTTIVCFSYCDGKTHVVDLY